LARRKPLLIAALVAPALAAASTTYTAPQLQRMIDAGSPPPQRGASSETRALSFADCVKAIEQVQAATARYPSKTVIDTRTLRVVKIWAADAALTTTCSADDRKMTITTSPYQ
jgi:hypothetical protein